MRACRIRIGGSCVWRAAEKLRRASVPLLSAELTEKNLLTVTVDPRDRQKVFAILQNSCYNILGTESAGPYKVWLAVRRSVGLIAGLAVALGFVLFSQSRVLRVEVEGSGSYLAPQVRSVLAEEGVGFFSPLPKESELAPRILALPRVCFCSVKGSGGILTVVVEVGEDLSALTPSPLLCPHDGIVEELTVLRGVPLVTMGEEVKAGQILVGHTDGEESVLVIARVVIAYPVSAFYPATEQEALARAFLDYGELTGQKTEKTEKGWRVTGTAHAEASLNFD